MVMTLCTGSTMNSTTFGLTSSRRGVRVGLSDTWKEEFEIFLQNK